MSAQLPNSLRCNIAAGVKGVDRTSRGHSGIDGKGTRLSFGRHKAHHSAPGGIRVSGRIQEDVRRKLVIALEDLGAQQLKNIVRVHRVWLREGPTSGQEGLREFPRRSMNCY